jgi:butyryl-CoA dehydrogenase
MAGPLVKEELGGPLAEEFALLASAKKLALFAAGAATQKYMQQLQDQQEIMGAIADLIIEIFAMESAILRADKMASKSSADIPITIARIYASTALERIELMARRIVGAVAEGDMLRTQTTILRRLAKYDLLDTVGLRRKVAKHMIRAGKYSL